MTADDPSVHAGEPEPSRPPPANGGPASSKGQKQGADPVKPQPYSREQIERTIPADPDPDDPVSP